MVSDQSHFISVDHIPIAVRHRPAASSGNGPGIVWLGGFRSDMTGAKAESLDAWAAQNGRAFLRHDYSGHGASGGRFVDGTISRWLNESLAVFRRFTTGPQILVGSSMGAWIALRMVEELRTSRKDGAGDHEAAEAGAGNHGAGGTGAGEHGTFEGGAVEGGANGSTLIAGLVLIAPAPDFTTDLMEPLLTETQKRDLDTKGFFEEASGYSPDPNIYTRALFEDGRLNRVLTGRIDTHCPVHILQGLADPDVPYAHALKLAEHLPADDVTLSLIPGGDHRLSRPEDLAMLVRAVEGMA